MEEKTENIKEITKNVNSVDDNELHNYINDLLKSKEEKIEYARLINILISVGVPKEEVLIVLSENINNILENYKEKRAWNYDFIELVNALIKGANLDNEKIEIIQNKIALGYIKNYEKLLSITDYKMNTINTLIEIGIPKECIIKIKDLIKEKIVGKDYLDFVKLIDSYDVEFEEPPTIEEFLRKLFSSPNDYSIVKNIPKLTIILEEQMEIENVCFYDLEILGAGEYSKAIKVGNYAVKIGTHRENSDVPTHPKIINSGYWTLLNTDIYETFAEIQECVDNNWYQNLTEEEIVEKEYELFKELKDDGISWIDVKKENMGMKNGVLIVIDKDHLYRNGNEAMRLPTKYIEFMMRYNKEQKIRKKEIKN